MIFWLLTFVVCFKYIGVLMRVSHHGEGGIFAITQILTAEKDEKGEPKLSSGARGVVLFLAMLGGSLIAADGVITPVQSVLGAFETTPAPTGECVSMAVAVLAFIFMIQRRGSHVIGLVAGPIMVIWFLVIGGLGLFNMLQHPDEARAVLLGLNPANIVTFWTSGPFAGLRAWRSLSGVTLAVTGAEALYADMGHFGARPIMLAWFGLVYPCLVLQYMGQTVMICINPAGSTNAFTNAIPEGLGVPMMILSILAAIIASQALITGLFTMFTQAYALKMVPRLQILHTNPYHQGQVYIPEINWAICTACVVICVIFQTSANLSNAYGICVTCCFVVTTCLLGFVLRKVWGWCWLAVLSIILPMITIDVMICSANLAKVFDKGWIPLVIAAALLLLMNTHRWGRDHEEAIFAEEARREDVLVTRNLNVSSECTEPQEQARAPCLATVSTVPGLLRILRSGGLVRTPTACVFMTACGWRVPTTVGALAAMGWLPEAIVLLSVKFEDTPFVEEAERSAFVAHGEGVFVVVLRFGYAEPLTAARIGVHAAMARVAREQLEDHPALAPLLSLAQPGLGADAPPSPERAAGSASARHRADPELGGEAWQQHRQRQQHGSATIVLGKLHYAPRPEHGGLVKLRIRLYSFFVLNARKAITFFGLEECNTMEISVVRFM
jgi:KUP system potassium uptake protein